MFFLKFTFTSHSKNCLNDGVMNTESFIVCESLMTQWGSMSVDFSEKWKSFSHSFFHFSNFYVDPSFTPHFIFDHSHGKKRMNLCATCVWLCRWTKQSHLACFIPYMEFINKNIVLFYKSFFFCDELWIKLMALKKNGYTWLFHW